MEHLNHLPVPALHRLERLPEGFTDTPVEKIGSILLGPSLIWIEGEPGPPLFVSILLHGNETTGFDATQRLLKAYDAPRRPLPRPLLLFVGNVAAAGLGLRTLDGQADYNRIWHDERYPEHRLAQEVLAEIAKASPLAAIDLHNNTGKNPHYGCVNRLDDATLSLARRFSKTIVWFTEPHEVISIALSQICPSVTLECGVSGNAAGTSHVERYLQNCLELSAEELFTPPPNHLSDLFHTTAKIVVRDRLRLEFGVCGNEADLCLRKDLETLNFERVPEGAELGSYRGNAPPLVVIDNDECDVTNRYLRFSEERIFTRLPIVPSMFTRDVRVIMQDCLGYIMEPYEVKGTV
ncbi:M14 family metallopeptidase [Chlorobaculum sp. MV4-Y]|uniref:M14 family metallopeptidase n=1 Tax=Chlorobaculum sp. MV4-Y TaxID=2976335 RepID=UPI0021B0117B|nr:M14 family metallopeptidase [Chlorobaculum sp. MV4-Y]UWX57289.1 M14 family metallopeptidase [Chlorobaculum sp. MV4-Y]